MNAIQARQEVKITPGDKKRASIRLLWGGTFILLAGSVPLLAPFWRGDYWLIIICGPFALLAWWIGRVLLGAYLNSAFSTTEVEFEADRVSVRNRPFGRSFDIAYSDIRACMTEDIVSRKDCLEMLLIDRTQRTYQVCAFREMSAPIESLYTSITARLQQAIGGSGALRP